MGVALFLIGILAILAGVVVLVIALVRKRGWGIVRALALGGVGIVLVIVGIGVGIGEVTEKSETITPATTVTPTTPESPEVTELGKSRLNPVPVGSSLTYSNQRVTVLSSQRVKKKSEYTASEDKIYLIVKLKVEFLGDAPRSYHLGRSSFDVVGSSGYVYENGYGYQYVLLDTDTPLKSGDFYGGASTSGDLVYEIDETETNMVLIWHVGFTIERYLQIP